MTRLLGIETFWLKNSGEGTVGIAGLWCAVFRTSAVWTQPQELSSVTEDYNHLEVWSGHPRWPFQVAWPSPGNGAVRELEVCHES